MTRLLFALALLGCTETPKATTSDRTLAGNAECSVVTIGQCRYALCVGHGYSYVPALAPYGECNPEPRKDVTP